MSEVALMPRKRVLVTDDDPSILRLVSIVMARAGYEVDTATGGEDALQKAALEQYDVIVLDLMMPNGSGFDVLARLPIRHSRPRYVIVTSAASPDMLRKAVGQNVFAALRKPFDIAEIVETVRACMSRSHRT